MPWSPSPSWPPWRHPRSTSRARPVRIRRSRSPRRSTTIRPPEPSSPRPRTRCATPSACATTARSTADGATAARDRGRRPPGRAASPLRHPQRRVLRAPGRRRRRHQRLDVPRPVRAAADPRPGQGPPDARRRRPSARRPRCSTSARTISSMRPRTTTTRSRPPTRPAPKADEAIADTGARDLPAVAYIAYRDAAFAADRGPPRVPPVGRRARRHRADQLGARPQPGRLDRPPRTGRSPSCGASAAPRPPTATRAPSTATTPIDVAVGPMQLTPAAWTAFRDRR